MTRLIAILATFAATSALATETGDVLNCFESPAAAINAKREQISIKVTVGKKIAGYGKDANGEYFDSIHQVRAEVFSRDPKVSGSRYARKRSIVTTVVAEDVYFTIEDKAQGIYFHAYMDELDQTTARIRGVRGEISLTCR